MSQSTLKQVQKYAWIRKIGKDVIVAKEMWGKVSESICTIYMNDSVSWC